MSKPLLCIIPGWGGNKETWKEFIEQAEDFFDVRCIELPCFGGVVCPHTAWGIDQFAEYVHQQLVEIKKENPHNKIILLGHSFGGQVATLVAKKYPHTFDELVLIAPAIVRPKRRIKRTIFGTAAKILKLILHTNQHNTNTSELKKKIYNAFFSPDYTDTSGIKREIFKKVIREDVQEALPHIEQDVLLFWGKRDSYTPLRHGKKIAQKLKKVELIIFPNGKHGLHHTHTKDILRKLKERYTKD